MKNDRESIVIIKRNHQSQEVWRYSGWIVERSTRGVLVEALFNRSDLPFHGLVFKQNDRFLELYLNDHWFNIFQIHDRDSNQLKAWYCNVTRPVEFKDDHIAYDDLALDLLVYPDGKQLVLDRDDFEALELSRFDRKMAEAGLKLLQRMLKNPARFNMYMLLGRD